MLKFKKLVLTKDRYGAGYVLPRGGKGHHQLSNQRRLRDQRKRRALPRSTKSHILKLESGAQKALNTVIIFQDYFCKSHICNLQFCTIRDLFTWFLHCNIFCIITFYKVILIKINTSWIISNYKLNPNLICLIEPML